MAFWRRHTFVWSSITLALSSYTAAYARDDFDLRVLESNSPLENTKTLEDFLNNNGLSAGDYLTSVMWGQDFLQKKNIKYVLSADKEKLIPQLSKAELRELGVKVDSLSSFNQLADEAIVGDIADYIDGAKYDFQPESQTLWLRIPQLYRDSQAADDVPPKYWDDGSTAAWVSYFASGSRQQNDGENQSSSWLNVNSGINLGAWRLRNNSTYSDSDWDTISTTLARDIKALRSQLEVGQTFTNGDLFDSVQMTGVKLETDNNMLPNNQQGFAPVVRGIANSDAEVTIKQNGYTIYQTWVSAGPFEIRDLSQVTAGSDLEVHVKEANGQEHSFIQASSSVPLLQREGALKYSLALGKYRDSDNGMEPQFGQATSQYGLPYGITAYGGVLAASMYQSGVLGTGADLGRIGSLSVDVTMAKAQFNDGRNDATGLSWRMQYAKEFPSTDTTVTLASYRYSTSDFYTFQEALDQRDTPDDDDIYSYRQTNNRRSRLQLNLSQSVGSMGSVYINGYQQDYWDLPGHERSLSMGFSSNWRDITWSVNYTLTKTPYSDSDQQASLTLNIPLSRWLPSSWATYNVNSSKRGNTTHQVGIGGTALADNNLSYSLQQSYTDNNVGYGASMTGRYRNSMGEYGVGYSYDKNSSQWNYNAQGAIVAHPHGITLGQSVQDAFAVVHIKDGANVKVQNAQGVYTDYWGNAIVPNLTNYRHNSVTVNTQGHQNLDISDASKDVIPTKGAVVVVDYDARKGVRALLSLKRGNRWVPFGALMSVDNTTAIVGDSGEVYVTGIQESVPFKVQWGNAPDEQCSGVIVVKGQDTGIYKAVVDCN